MTFKETNAPRFVSDGTADDFCTLFTANRFSRTFQLTIVRPPLTPSQHTCFRQSLNTLAETMPFWKKRTKKAVEDRGATSSAQTLTQPMSMSDRTPASQVPETHNPADTGQQVQRPTETPPGQRTEQHLPITPAFVDASAAGANTDAIRERARQPATAPGASPSDLPVENRAQELPTSEPTVQQTFSSSNATESQGNRLLRVSLGSS